MNPEEINTLIKKLEATGYERVEENLRHNRYSSRKLTYIEEWLNKQDDRTWLYHETKEPKGKIFKRHEVQSLQKHGWVDTPDKFGKGFRSRMRRAYMSVWAFWLRRWSILLPMIVGAIVALYIHFDSLPDRNGTPTKQAEISQSHNNSPNPKMKADD